MAERWSIYATHGAGLVIVVQSDALVDLDSRIVVPLVPASAVQRPHPRLTPTVSVGDEAFLADAVALSAIPLSALSTRVGHAGQHSDAVLAAIDMALTGV